MCYLSQGWRRDFVLYGLERSGRHIHCCLQPWIKGSGKHFPGWNNSKDALIRRVWRSNMPGEFNPQPWLRQCGAQTGGRFTAPHLPYTPPLYLCFSWTQQFFFEEYWIHNVRICIIYLAFSCFKHQLKDGMFFYAPEDDIQALIIQHFPDLLHMKPLQRQLDKP